MQWIAWCHFLEKSHWPETPKLFTHVRRGEQEKDNILHAQINCATTYDMKLKQTLPQLKRSAATKAIMLLQR